jgi:twinkle protein
MSQLLQNHIAPLDPEALAALEARGFDAEEFLQLGLGVGLEAGSSRLAVPYREQGQVVAIRTGALEVGFSGLLSAKWLGMSEPPLYNVDCLRDASLANEPLLVVESEMACWAAMVSGFRRVVGVAAVLAMDGRRQPQLEAAAELMRDASEIVIATFDDERGQRLRANIAETIGAVRCKWVSYPKGCADLVSTLRAHKARGVQATIKRAQWFAMPGFYSMSELPDPPLNPAYGTGIVGLDEHMRLRRGDLTIVSGVPGAGKTTVVNEFFCRLAKARGLRTIWASFEQRAKPDHRRTPPDLPCREAGTGHDGRGEGGSRQVD